jgi:hypothetical protein
MREAWHEEHVGAGPHQKVITDQTDPRVSDAHLDLDGSTGDRDRIRRRRHGRQRCEYEYQHHPPNVSQSARWRTLPEPDMRVWASVAP